MNPEFIALGFLWYVAFLFSLTCHEASHALVARWGGDLTATKGGQVTLNLLPHIRREIFGTTIVPILSIPPLDGHGAICLFFTENFARRFTKATHNPSLAMIGLLVGWKVFGYLYAPLFSLALNVLYPGGGYR